MQPRPCERCGATVEAEEYGGDQFDRYHPMCVETQIAYGMIAWLCFDCRKAWHRDMKNNRLSKQYSEASLRFEFWKARVGPSSETTLEEGLVLWRELDSLEMRLNDFANEWLVTDSDKPITLELPDDDD